MIQEILYKFWNKVIFTTDCWEWQGAKHQQGYGMFWLVDSMVLAHRFAYELIKKIPQGMVLDHLCRNTSCVNPDHLEAVTQKENLLRGIGLTAINSQKTHCLRGHEFTVTKSGRRKCMTCLRINSLKHYYASKEVKSQLRVIENKTEY